MSQFFDYEVNSNHGASTVTMAFSSLEGVVAVSSSNHQVNFYQEEGELIRGHIIERKCDAVVLSWRSKSHVLAIGWEDGVVSLYNMQDKQNRDNKSVHNGAITMMQWSPSGNRLIAGDKNGILSVWKCDPRGQMSPVIQYRKSGAITHCVYCTGESFSSDLQSMSPSFFFGSSQGLVCYADDLGHCTEVQSLTSAIDAMMFYEERQRLIIITRSLLMTKLQVSEDGRVTPIMKVKLSVTSSDSGMRDVIWAGPGLLATASNESMIRFWSMSHDENYVLSLSSVPGMARTDRVTALDFNPRKRMLAAGTRDGKVVMWKFHGQLNASNSGSNSSSSGSGGDSTLLTSASMWEPQPVLTMTAAGSSTSSSSVGGGGGGPNSRITSISWGVGQQLLGVGLNHTVVVLSETVLYRQLRDDMAALQTAADRVQLYSHAQGHVGQVRTGIRVRGLTVDERSLVVYNGKKAEVYGVRESPLRQTGSFSSSASCMALRGESIYCCADGAVQVCNLQGVVKHVVPFADSDGVPVELDVNGSYMAVATSTGAIKLFNVKRTEPKPCGTSGRFVEPSNPDKLIGLIRSVRVNADGTRVSVVADLVHGSLRVVQPDTRLHMYDADMGVVTSYDFGPHRYPVGHAWDHKEPKLVVVETAGMKQGAEAKSEPLSNSAASKFKTELANDVDAEGGKGEKKEEGEGKMEEGKEREKEKDTRRGGSGVGAGAQAAKSEVTSLFVTSDHGILMQDSFGLEAEAATMGASELSLLGVQVPRLYFVSTGGSGNNSGSNSGSGRYPDGQSGGEEGASSGGGGEGKTSMEGAAGASSEEGGGGASARVSSRVMRDFMGLEQVDETTRLALLDFSYFLTVGNMDEAYRAVKLIRSPGVWENMAHMCVKTKRLDVAEVCLGNMGHARGARAVREQKEEGTEKAAVVGMVAIQLGLLDDAARLFKECGRYDLLNKLYQATGYWERALDVAVHKDRIHLRSTHYQYARHLESVGDASGAIKHYERSDTHRKEVPRMLFSAHRLDDLEGYVNMSDDRELLKWWAQYCESNGRFDKASHYYSRARDHLSLVRVLCYNGEFTQAADIAANSGSSAAAYHLARQYESNGNVQEAITQFSRAGRYNHAIRLAKEHGLDSELMTFALQAGKRLMLDCAEYFEAKGEFEKAVQLYQKGSNIPRALDLCFRSQLFEVLRNIADELSEKTDSAVLVRCADFFVDHGQYDKAAHLLITAKRYSQALELCMNHKVKITEETAERMTPDKTDDKEQNEVRLDLLRKLAKACRKQGSFHLATKKYTQAGDKVKAMKCLLKSGDTEKVIFFATVSRTKEIYVLAANYLQGLDWHNDADVMKSIIQFYSKAKAFTQLSGFYDACAQVEIDEYRDYEKALGALHEAEKYAVRARGGNSGAGAKEDGLFNLLKQRIMLVDKFVAARSCAKTEPSEMVKLCQQLLDHSEVETAIRVGDAYALLVEYYYGAKNFEQAYKLIEQMQKRRIILNPYLDQDMVDAIHRALGIEQQDGGSGSGADRAQSKRGDGGEGGGDAKGFGGSRAESKGMDDNEIEEDVEDDIAEEDGL